MVVHEVKIVFFVDVVFFRRADDFAEVVTDDGAREDFSRRKNPAAFVAGFSNFPGIVRYKKHMFLSSRAYARDPVRFLTSFEMTGINSSTKSPNCLIV